MQEVTTQLNSHKHDSSIHFAISYHFAAYYTTRN